MRRLRESSEFRNLTVEMIEELYAEDLEDYIHIENGPLSGPFSEGTTTLISIEGGDYNVIGLARGYEGYKEDGYEDEDEALDDFLKNNKVYVFTDDIGQSGCNWLDENMLIERLDDIYIDLDEVGSADSDTKKVFRSLGIVSSEKRSKTIVYTVELQIDTYDDWEDDYDSFDDYVDDVVSDVEKSLNEIAYDNEGVTINIER